MNKLSAILTLVLLIACYSLTFGQQIGEKYIFKESFNQDINNIDLPKSGVNYSSESGAFYITRSDDFSRKIYLLNNYYHLQSTDWEIETKWTSYSSNDGFGLIFGFLDLANYQTIYLNKNQLKWVTVLGGQNKVQLISDSIGLLSGINKLSIKKTGSRITICINNKVFSVNDSSSQMNYKGKIGWYLPGLGTYKLKSMWVKAFGQINQLAIANSQLLTKTPLCNNINHSASSQFAPLLSKDASKLYFIKSDVSTDKEVIQMASNPYKNVFCNDISTPNNLNFADFNAVLSEDNLGEILLHNTFKEEKPSTNSNFYLYNKKEIKSEPKPISIDRYKPCGSNEYATLSPDGQYLLLTYKDCFEGDSSPNYNVYLSRRLSTYHFSSPIKLPKTVNSSADEYSAILSEDSKCLYFSSDGHFGFGGSDVFLSYRLDDTYLKWSEPLNLGKIINSNANDEAFFIHQKVNISYISSYDKISKSFKIFSIDTKTLKKEINREVQAIPNKTDIANSITNIPPVFLNRKTAVQKKFTVDSTLMNLYIWDDQAIDGDKVDIYLNGQLIRGNILLSSGKTIIPLQLIKRKINYIIMHAINLGNVPPNTAAMQLGDEESNDKVFKLFSTLSSSGVLEIFVK